MPLPRAMGERYAARAGNLATELQAVRDELRTALVHFEAGDPYEMRDIVARAERAATLQINRLADEDKIIDAAAVVMNGAAA